MSKAVEADDRTDEFDATTSDEAAVSILTTGDPIRSLVQLPTTIVNEATVRFDADGIHLRAVDPANVCMVDLTAHAEGFDAYRMPDPDAEIVVGMNLARLASALGWARKRGDGDPVTLDVLTDPTRVRVSVTRPDQGVKRTSEWFGIDPDSIREEPDGPDLDLPCYADPDIRGFHDAVTAFGPDHAQVAYDDGTLVLTSDYDDDDMGEDSVFFPNAAWADGEDANASSIFSLDYLEDVAAAVKRSKADKLTLNWGEEFPVIIDVAHEEWGFDARYLLAPRIQGDD